MFDKKEVADRFVKAEAPAKPLVIRDNFTSAERRIWQCVAAGLILKLFALMVCAGLPALAAWLWQANGDFRWLLAGLAAAAVPDFLGRCLCIAAPVARRIPITLSVTLQLTAIVTLGVLALGGRQDDLIIGLIVAAPLQLGAAALFTWFLRAAGDTLGRAEVSHHADRLGMLMSQSLLATSGLGLATLLAAVIVLIAAIVTCGFGLYIATPVAAVVLLPFALLTIGIVAAMYWAYSSTMTRLLLAIHSLSAE